MGYIKKEDWFFVVGVIDGVVDAWGGEEATALGLYCLVG